MASLSAEGLRASYGGTTALEEVDVDVQPGEVVALLGRNGAGKTTLLRCLAGLHRPDAGRVWLDGQDVTGLPASARARRGLAMVPEGGGVFPALTVEETLRVATPPGIEPRDRMAEVVERLPLVGSLRRRVVGTLSGGERRQVAVARALMRHPRVLLVDELSLGLAPQALEALVEVLRGVNAGGTGLLLVEQRVDVALRLATRGVVLERGRVRLRGSGSELGAAGAELRAAYLGDGSSAARRPAASAADPPGEERLTLPLRNRVRRDLQEAADAVGVTPGAYVARLVEAHLGAAPEEAG